MKTSSSLFFLAASLVLTSVSVSAQTNANASNSSLTEIQKSIAKTINKNSTFVSSYGIQRTADVKFDGCKMRYVNYYEPSRPVSVDAPMEGGLSSLNTNNKIGAWYVSFDLKDIDPARISVSERPVNPLTGADRDYVDLFTMDNKAFSVKRSGSLEIPLVADGDKRARLPVKSQVSAQVASDLLKAVNICQGVK
jgi:hypothetical protein